VKPLGFCPDQETTTITDQNQDEIEIRSGMSVGSAAYPRPAGMCANAATGISRRVFFDLKRLEQTTVRSSILLP
jgi:hypothetical protein